MRMSLLFLSFFVSTTAFAAPVDWMIDEAHSHVGFTVKHLALTTVRGQFRKYSGTVKADDASAKIQALEAKAVVATIDTGNEKRDKHLQGEDFFDAAKFPELTLKCAGEKVKWTGTAFEATCDLTMRGVTKPAVFKGEATAPVKLKMGDNQLRVSYTASAKVNRKDFGLAYAKMVEAVPIVSDDVTITIELELFRKL
jgi:polyisoprenoid-binding protein YceI